MDIRVRGYHLTGDENKVKVEVGTAEKRKWVKAQIIGFHPYFARMRTEHGYVVTVLYQDFKTKVKGVKVEHE